MVRGDKKPMIDKGEKKLRPNYHPWSEETRRRHEEANARRRAQAAEQKAKEPPPLPEKPKKKPRGNPPVVQYKEYRENPENAATISRLMTETLQSYVKPRVRNDAELEERFVEFYKECAEYGKIPTLEELFLSTGYSLSYMKMIMTGERKGFSHESKNIIIRAKEFLRTFDAKLVVTGELNPIIYIFRAKNFYSMKDQQDVVFNAGTDRIAQLSDEAIADWYNEDSQKTIETTFKEDEAQK